jgi:transcriptional regulator of aromatic amino acid metabolism
MFGIENGVSTGVIKRKAVKVGGRAPLDVDFRLISTTNVVDLKRAVQGGQFRQNLFYLLNVISLTLPLLNDRGEDILILDENWLSKNAASLGRSPLSLSPEARKCLTAYDWPGNVRGLNNESLQLIPRISIGAVYSSLGKILFELAAYVSGVMIVLAALDYLFQRWQHKIKLIDTGKTPLYTTIYQIDI